VSSLIYLDAAYDHSEIGKLLVGFPAPPPMSASDSASPVAVQAYTRRVFGMVVPEAQLRAIARYDATGRLIADVTSPAIDSAMLAGCGHPNFAAVHTPALVIDAIIDSAAQVFPLYPTMSAAGQETARHFTSVLQEWGAAGRARVRRELQGMHMVELHGANHYVFFSNRSEVSASMHGFLAGEQAAESASR
jgi:hypothetical protein